MLPEMQKWSKESVDELIDNLPKEEKIIMKCLRSLVLECLPSATEKNMYGVPYYSHKRIICFIWPPTIYWGKDKSIQKKGVTLGFYHGNKMLNEDGALLAEGRKQVYCMYFKSVKEINEVQIRALLFEADLIDKEFRKRKKNNLDFVPFVHPVVNFVNVTIAIA